MMTEEVAALVRTQRKGKRKKMSVGWPVDKREKWIAEGPGC